jgi:uncharacterized protein (DUF1330 family)
MAETCAPMRVTNTLHPGAGQLQAFFGAAEDGPFVMLNLLRFRDKALYPDGRDAGLSGMEAYQRYGAGVKPLIERVGGKLGYSGHVTGLMLGEVEDLWDMVALAQYPSLAAFREMVMSPDYQAISVHRDAGLLGQLNIRTKAVGR